MILYKQNSTKNTNNKVNITFTCAVHGQPLPKFNWFFRNQPIDDFRNILHYNQMNNTIDKKVVSSSLVFFNITKANEGFVRCVGQNKVGEISSIGFFKVFGRSFILFSLLFCKHTKGNCCCLFYLNFFIYFYLKFSAS